MLKAGIVGLPNVGKSTLFNAVTRTRKAESANYPFCTIDPNIGVVNVPDPRLEPLSKLSGSQKIVPTAIEFVDIAGLVKGASEGAGLGNQPGLPVDVIVNDGGRAAHGKRGGKHLVRGQVEHGFYLGSQLITQVDKPAAAKRQPGRVTVPLFVAPPVVERGEKARRSACVAALQSSVP